ncbi:glycosyltransferase family 2 protein [Amaricoccus sp.]|uniref:glycosyltransferase family 2 protein n=1 Tax=Amaricoccus sp. TaxID=1872485 RepID=UPI001B46DB63|nr:glycosyltransferase family 2 protein [Amaricoccus sp.]MBP7001996.1 glycosyltransferase family 2 protein [Amaricoccus sp.]
MTVTGEAPLVSVVLPAFDRAKTVGAAMGSVLRQTWRDLELIVVDDGSADDTFEAARRVADARTRVIRSDANLGAGAARNLGIAEARGQWVAFQDSDDEWLPLKLEKQMARLLAPDAGYVGAYCGMAILGAPGAGRLRPRYFPGDDADLYEQDRLAMLLRRRLPWLARPRPAVLEGDLVAPLLRRSLISTQTFVARRDLLREVGGFDPGLRVMIDRDCALRLAARGPIAFVDEPLVLQWLSPNSISADRGRWLPSQIRLTEAHAALLERHPAAHAWLHYAIAGGQRRAGDLDAARAAIGRACRLRPWSLRYRAMALGLRLRALLAAAGGASRRDGG